jgi:NADH-quinone oxidoreductase subunit C
VTQVANANANVVVEQLRGWNAQAVAQVLEHRGETTIVVPHEMLRAAAIQCRDNPALKFNLLSDATCVDRFPVEPRFELNYQLLSLERRERVRLRTSVGGEQQPVVESLVPVWPGANWMEREIFDLFGIRFDGHPDLRRILLPDGFEGFPLRRDFPVEGKR